MSLPSHHPLNSLTCDSLLVQNLRGTRTKQRPVWFMRQAGRSLPEYRELRERVPMLESCLTPELAAEFTLQPVRRHRVDAAIFFSDIVVPLRLAGLDVDIVSGVGPVLAEPVRSYADLRRLQGVHPDVFAPVREAVRLVVAELGATPLIGFGGAPFTLASYLIEGGPSHDLLRVRAMMYHDPDLWSAVLRWCAETTAQFISAQVHAGASTLQVFDSWAGRLTRNEYLSFAYPYSKQLFGLLRQLTDRQGLAVPRVHFGVGTRSILTPMLTAGATALGIDSATRLRCASDEVGAHVPLQGNISPHVLNQPWDVVETHVRAVLASGSRACGHVVNLGHGVPKDTNPDVLTRITSLVQDIRS